MPMSQQEIQSLVDRLRLLAQTLGWTVVRVDTTGPELIIELRRPKETQ